MNVLDRYRQVLEEIAEACMLGCRHPSTVRLLTVTKSHPWPDVSSLYDAGQRDFGENRLIEALEKKGMAPRDCQWHWIGTLQKNKVRKVICEFVLIHSVDSLGLARKISQLSVELNTVSHILLQANLSGEASKHGLTGEEWKACFEDLASLPNLSVDGLMTMGALTDDERSARRNFGNLRQLRDELRALSQGMLPLKELSMGMSRDFKWAIQEGATIVRVGSLLWS